MYAEAKWHGTSKKKNLLGENSNEKSKGRKGLSQTN